MCTFRGRGGRRGRGGYVQQAFYRPIPGQRFVVTHTPFDLVKVVLTQLSRFHSHIFTFLINSRHTQNSFVNFSGINLISKSCSKSWWECTYTGFKTWADHVIIWMQQNYVIMFSMPRLFWNEIKSSHLHLMSRYKAKNILNKCLTIIGWGWAWYQKLFRHRSIFLLNIRGRDSIDLGLILDIVQNQNSVLVLLYNFKSKNFQNILYGNHKVFCASTYLNLSENNL